MPITFILDGVKPTPMHRPRVSIRGGYPHAYKDKKQKEYEDALDFAISKRWYLMGTDSNKPAPISNPCKLEVQFWFKQPKSNKTNYHQQRPDVDNLTKQLLDSLVRCGVITDDSIIYDIHAQKLWRENDAVRFEITLME